MPLLLANCTYLIRNPDRIERDCDLLIEGARIQAIGPHLRVPPGTEVLDGRGCAVIPGLINAHTHLYQNFMKGISPGLPLVPWCEQVLFPSVDAVRRGMSTDQPRLAYLWSALAALEMLRGGVTCCIDMDMVYPGVVQAWQNLGLRGVLAYTLTNRWVPAELRAEEEAMKAKTLEFVARYHDPQGLVTVCLAPSTLFLCTDDFLGWIGEQAARLELGLQIHISESAGEIPDQLAESGRRPVEHLAHLGLLGKRLSAVHCVHLDPHELELLAASATTVVHCPKSNMKLADGAAPVVDMLRRGIPVALGTDGCASNDLLDMWEEMRAAVLLARLTNQDADALGPRQAFRMATLAAAQAAGIEAGQLEPGALADVAVVELGAAHLQPFNDDPLNMLVFCARASDVRDTIVHGRPVMLGRRFPAIDEAGLVREAAALGPQLQQARALYRPAA